MNDDIKKHNELNKQLLLATAKGDVRRAVAALERGADVNVTGCHGLKPVHIAAALNDLPLARTLIEDWNAALGPDGFGRWPSHVAAECNPGEAMGDYLLEKEAEQWIRTAPDSAEAKICMIDFPHLQPRA